MKFTGEVIAVVQDSYKSKRGTDVEQVIVTLLDQDRHGGCRLLKNVEFVVARDELAKGKVLVEGAVVELGIWEIRPAFNGVMRFYGRVLGVVPRE